MFLANVINPEVRGRHRDQNRPIIVKFASYRKRNTVFYNKKKLKGSNIMITENLTKKRYDLLKLSLQKLGRNSCWSKDGRILTKYEGKIVEIFGWNDDGSMETNMESTNE